MAIENEHELEPSETNEPGSSGQVASDRGSEPFVENGAPDNLASEELNSKASGVAPSEEQQDPLSAMTAERDELKDQLLRAMADATERYVPPERA